MQIIQRKTLILLTSRKWEPKIEGQLLLKQTVAQLVRMKNGFSDYDKINL